MNLTKWFVKNIKKMEGGAEKETLKVNLKTFLLHRYSSLR